MRDFIRQTIKDAGSLAKGHFERGVSHETKSNLADLVTEADIAVSDYLIQKISEAYPDHMIVSEERDEIINPGADFEWVIDPVDGTRPFALGIPMWCVIISVLYRDEVMYGAVYNPIADQLFFAEKGQGAYMNDYPMEVNKVTEIENSFCTTSRAYEGPVYGQYADRFRTAQERIARETDAWMYQYGSMLNLCYLASGAVDFWFQNAGLDHDYLGPVLIAREAGAIVTDSDGNPWKRGRQDAVAANPEMHKKIMEFFK